MKNYFVYGALMMSPKVLKNGRAAYIKDYAVEMRLRGSSSFLEPSFAVLFSKHSATAWGVVTTLSDEEWRSISGHEESYHLDHLIAYDQDGNAFEVQAFVSQNVYNTEINPSSRYARMLYRASVRYQLPAEVCTRYYHMMNQGNKTTRIVFWYTPLVKKLIPRLGVRRAKKCVLWLHLIIVLAVVIALAVI